MIVLVGHGSLPEAFKQSIEMILGETEEIYTVCLTPEEGDEGLRKKLDGIDDKIKAADHATFFTDILGGSPCNTVIERYGKLENTQIVAGTNLSVLLAATIEGKQGDELVTAGKTALCDVSKSLTVSDESSPAAPLSLPYDAGDSHEVVGVRIDSRGIHGQVAAAWIPAMNATRVLIVDDQIVQNDMQKMALKMAKPEGVKLSILTSDVAAVRLSDEGFYPGEKIFVVMTNVMTLKKLDEKGFHFQTVNMGNVPNRPGTERYANTVYLSKHEIEVVRELIEKGTHFTVCQVPKDPIEDFDSLIGH